MKDLDVEVLLKIIGKRIFVEYYDFFEKLKHDELDPEDVVETLPKYLTLKSRQTRTLKAKRIFQEGLEHKAIETIIRSNKVDDETINLAKSIQKQQ